MIKRIFSVFSLLCFVFTGVIGTCPVHAQEALSLPVPGTMVNLSPAYEPVLIKGLKVHPKNPFLFDFIIDTGTDSLPLRGEGKGGGNQEHLKQESQKLIKYFLAAMTVPEKDLWVNLSPYEKDRMIAPNLGQTEMGRDMLAQDYILKQLTASLIYPERNLGKTFWDEVYAKARELYGTTQIPVNTFNKVWIVADKADVFERGNVAYIVGAHLKVMLEEDYLATFKHQRQPGDMASAVSPSVSSQIIRQLILPQIEKEVNQGKNFAPLRQMFYSMILASWYKMSLKDAILTQIYGNQSKVKVGINQQDTKANGEIFNRYLKAYKKGVFNYIKEDIDQTSQQPIPRKYFSGGLQIGVPQVLKRIKDFAMLNEDDALGVKGNLLDVNMIVNPSFRVEQAKSDTAMADNAFRKNSFLDSFLKQEKSKGFEDPIKHFNEQLWEVPSTSQKTIVITLIPYHTVRFNGVSPNIVYKVRLEVVEGKLRFIFTHDKEIFNFQIDDSGYEPGRKIMQVYKLKENKKGKSELKKILAKLLLNLESANDLKAFNDSPLTTITTNPSGYLSVSPHPYHLIIFGTSSPNTDYHVIVEKIDGKVRVMFVNDKQEITYQIDDYAYDPRRRNSKPLTAHIIHSKHKQDSAMVTKSDEAMTSSLDEEIRKTISSKGFKAAIVLYSGDDRRLLINGKKEALLALEDIMNEGVGKVILSNGEIIRANKLLELVKKTDANSSITGAYVAIDPSRILLSIPIKNEIEQIVEIDRSIGAKSDTAMVATANNGPEPQQEGWVVNKLEPMFFEDAIGEFKKLPVNNNTELIGAITINNKNQVLLRIADNVTTMLMNLNGKGHSLVLDNTEYEKSIAQNSLDWLSLTFRYMGGKLIQISLLSQAVNPHRDYTDKHLEFLGITRDSLPTDWKKDPYKNDMKKKLITILWLMNEALKDKVDTSKIEITTMQDWFPEIKKRDLKTYADLRKEDEAMVAEDVVAPYLDPDGWTSERETGPKETTITYFLTQKGSEDKQLNLTVRLENQGGDLRTIVHLDERPNDKKELIKEIILKGNQTSVSPWDLMAKYFHYVFEWTMPSPGNIPTLPVSNRIETEQKKVVNVLLTTDKFNITVRKQVAKLLRNRPGLINDKIWSLLYLHTRTPEDGGMEISAGVRSSCFKTLYLIDPQRAKKSGLFHSIVLERLGRTRIEEIEVLRGNPPDNDVIEFLNSLASTQVSTPGGIDLTRSRTKVTKQGQGVQMQFDPAMIERIKREGFDGLEFKIESIRPVTNLPILLGLEPVEEKEKLVGV